MASDLRRLVDAVREARGRYDAELVKNGPVSLKLAWLARKASFAESALCDAILACNAVDVVEAVRALGVARAAMDAANVENVPQWCAATRLRVDAQKALNELADRLAADGKEG